jgi:hypothetical protein
MDFSVYHLTFITHRISKILEKYFFLFQFDFAVPDGVMGELRMNNMMTLLLS